VQRSQSGRQRVQARRSVTTNVEVLTGRVERMVQNGVNVGMKLVNGAQDRIARIT
jgi:hypothetical protein